MKAMRVATILIFCMILLSSLPRMKAQQMKTCKIRLHLPNCYTGKCRDLCKDEIGGRLYYFGSDCAKGEPNICVCKLDCTNPPQQ
ncbi:hypothetical protein ACJIZ3_015754 [Penstemon smallii]|uniref:Uncharacterized protein n=1 Tax=Penstemon smallii TaxID=265156 RepID=A0ABD3RRS7_9LAMI